MGEIKYLYKVSGDEYSDHHTIAIFTDKNKAEDFAFDLADKAVAAGDHGCGYDEYGIRPIWITVYIANNKDAGPEGDNVCSNCFYNRPGEKSYKIKDFCWSGYRGFNEKSYRWDIPYVYDPVSDEWRAQQ